MENWRDSLFECAECNEPKQGCNIGAPTFEDSSGEPIEMKWYDPAQEEWQYHAALVQTSPHQGGAFWSAVVALPAGGKICAACSPCVTPL